MSEPHTFTVVNGRYRCDNEDVDADDCTDYDRCSSNGCVCNDREDDDA